MKNFKKQGKNSQKCPKIIKNFELPKKKRQKY